MYVLVDARVRASVCLNRTPNGAGHSPRGNTWKGGASSQTTTRFPTEFETTQPQAHRVDGEVVEQLTADVDTFNALPTSMYIAALDI